MARAQADQVLLDRKTAGVPPKLLAMLDFLEKMTLTPGALSAADVGTVFASGVSEQAFQDAIWVSMAFNMIDRIADTLGFDIPEQSGFESSAVNLMKRGYNIL